MRKVYRVLLYLVTLAVPVFIAACYGPSYRYRSGGKVADEPERLSPRPGVGADGGVGGTATP